MDMYVSMHLQYVYSALAVIMPDFRISIEYHLGR